MRKAKESAEALAVSLRAELEEAKREAQIQESAKEVLLGFVNDRTAKVERLEREKAELADYVDGYIESVLEDAQELTKEQLINSLRQLRKRAALAASAVTEPAAVCRCGHLSADHVDGVGICRRNVGRGDAFQDCNCSTFTAEQRGESRGKGERTERDAEHS